MAAKAQLRGASLDPIDGGSLTYYVDGLDGTTADIMYQACAAAGVPQRNDLFGVGLKIISGPRVSQMVGNFAALVEVGIGRDENQAPGGGASQGSIELTTRLVEERTMLDASGKAIEVRFDADRIGENVNPSLNTQTTVDGVATITESITQAGEVTRRVPLTVLRVTRNQTVLPINEQYRHVGTVNSANFFLFPPEYWLCAEISASSSDGQRTWDVTREFWGNQYGWLQGIGYRLEDGRMAPVSPSPILQPVPPKLRLETSGGLPVPGKPDQRWFNGFTLVRVQGTSDFTPMGITPPENIDS
jgi:hypothetical protein